MNVCLILGSVPEIAKLAFVVSELHELTHTDVLLRDSFTMRMYLPDPDHTSNCFHGSHARPSGSLPIVIKNCLKEARPKMVVVQGDTNTTLAGALAATKVNIPIAHIEAGCRSFDMRMPEEINRRIVVFPKMNSSDLIVEKLCQFSRPK
jgi:UDP-N-acetylglucosamine 2-epimerase